MIESLHPVTVAVAIVCVPVAAIALSAGIDYLAHRHREPSAPTPGIDRPASRPLQPSPHQSRKALPATTRSPVTPTKP